MKVFDADGNVNMEALKAAILKIKAISHPTDDQIVNMFEAFVGVEVEVTKAAIKMIRPEEA